MDSSRIAWRSAAAALALTASLPGIAAASNRLCVSHAAIVSRSKTLIITDYSRQHQTGVPLSGDALQADHFYDIEHGKLSIRYGANSYRLGSAESVVALSCYGQSRSQPADLPDLMLLEGSVKVTVSRDRPGAVDTAEGLYGPIPGRRLSAGYTFTVTRKLAHNPNLDEALKWFSGQAFSPTGKTVVAASGTSLVNITPYMGPHPGVCVHVKRGWLDSIGWAKVSGGYQPSGTVRYDPAQ